jgi:hypothetical protein
MQTDTTTKDKTAAARQAAYRQRRLRAGPEGNGDMLLNTWISAGAMLALKRLARRDGVSQRAMLEKLLLAADEAVLATLDVSAPEWDAYFG